MLKTRTVPLALLLLVATVLGGYALAGCGGEEPEGTGTTVAGSTTGQSPGGANLVREEFSLENFRGRPLLLNFWATW